MTNVAIKYCVPCGMLPRAQDLQETILEEFGEQVTRVALVTGDSGVFKVRVDGEQVFDKKTEEYDEQAIVDSVRSRVGATA
jgi:selenoprotein W-related protein